MKDYRKEVPIWEKSNLTANVKHFFTSLGNEFFTLCGKQFFTLSGNEFFTLYGKQFFTLPGKEFFTSPSGSRQSWQVPCQFNISGCLMRYDSPRKE